MCYTMKVGTDVANASRELAMHRIQTGPEHFNSLRRLIGYLKVKNTKGIIVRNPKVLKAVMFFYSNYALNKETRNVFSGLVDTF